MTATETMLPPSLEEQATLLSSARPLYPGIVSIAAEESARFTRFAASLQGLLTPTGSRTLWQLSSDTSDNRNASCKALLDLPDLQWVWFVDDDHVFPPRILLDLLRRNVDVVQANVLRRHGSFLHVATDLDRGFLDLRRYEKDALIEVLATGSSGMLVSRRVIEALEEPWFERGHDDQGRRISEDVMFCQRARDAGYEIHVDAAARMGHMTTCTVWPSWDEARDEWKIGFEIADGSLLAIPMTDPPEDLDAVDEAAGGDAVDATV